MTKKEAIWRLKDHFRVHDDGIPTPKLDEATAMAIEALQEPKWILVSEGMPEEHESMFAKFKGTNKWHKGMFEKLSDDVNVTVEFTDGTRKVMTMHTTDGEWDKDIFAVTYEVIAWMSLPEPYREGEK